MLVCAAIGAALICAGLELWEVGDLRDRVTRLEQALTPLDDLLEADDPGDDGGG